MGKDTKKNCCKICGDHVKTGKGLQCCGTCGCWYHFKCLCYSPKKIKAIKKGTERVECPCPDCCITPPPVNNPCTTEQSPCKLLVESFGHIGHSCCQQQPPICQSHQQNQCSQLDVPTYPTQPQSCHQYEPQSQHPISYGSQQPLYQPQQPTYYPQPSPYPSQQLMSSCPPDPCPPKLCMPNPCPPNPCPTNPCPPEICMHIPCPSDPCPPNPCPPNPSPRELCMHIPCPTNPCPPNPCPPNPSPPEICMHNPCPPNPYISIQCPPTPSIPSPCSQSLLLQPCSKKFCKECKKFCKKTKKKSKKAEKPQKLRDKSGACIHCETTPSLTSCCKQLTVCSSFDQMAKFRDVAGRKTPSKSSQKTQSETKVPSILKTKCESITQTVAQAETNDVVDSYCKDANKKSQEAKGLIKLICKEVVSRGTNPEGKITSYAKAYSCKSKSIPFTTLTSDDTDFVHTQPSSFTDRELFNPQTVIEQRALSLGTVEKMCKTVGKLTCQINDLMEKLRLRVAYPEQIPQGNKRITYDSSQKYRSSPTKQRNPVQEFT